jgi:hypothetical protein
MKRLFPITLALAVFSLFALSACDSSDSDSSVPPNSYSVYLYDDNLDFKELLTLTEGSVINLDDKSTEFSILTYGWYEAGSADILDGVYTVSADVTLYAAPNVAEISDEEGLINIKDALDGKYILKNDIALTDEWVPLGTGSSDNFSGVLEGGNYKITGLWIDGGIANDYTGLFGYSDGGVIKNLGVEISEKGLSGGRHVGGIVGYLRGEGRIENCYVAGGNILATGDRYGTVDAGGIVGYMQGAGLIKDSYSTADFFSMSNGGGIVGIINDSGRVENSYSAGNISGGYMIGGIAGMTSINAVIIKSHSSGSISANSYVGGIVGSLNAGGIIRGSYSTGSVTGGNAVGGIVGDTAGALEITNSYSTAYVFGSAYSVGGIAGGAYTNLVISNCYFSGVVNGNGGTIGGLVGSLNGNVVVKNSFFSGYLAGSYNSHYGGIAGSVSGSATITKNYSVGHMNINNADMNVGGIAGNISSGTGTGVIITDNVVASSAIFTGETTWPKNRVVGNIASTAIRTVSGNLVNEDIVTTQWSDFTDQSNPEKHGSDKTLDELKTETTYTAAGLAWAFGDDDDNPWVWGAFADYPYPTLYWQTEHP